MKKKVVKFNKSTLVKVLGVSAILGLITKTLYDIATSKDDDIVPFDEDDDYDDTNWEDLDEDLLYDEDYDEPD